MKLKHFCTSFVLFLTFFESASLAQNSNTESNSDAYKLSAPSFKSSDNKNSLVIDGRLQTDLGFLTKDKTNQTKNKTEIRRLWLGLSGTLNKDFEYRIAGGFQSGDQIEFNDIFLKYRGLKNLDIIAGNILANNGLSNNTSNLSTSLMERSSAITAFRQLRRQGFSINPYGENWGGQFGFFGSTIRNSPTGNNGHGFNFRLHAAPINDNEKKHYLHIGFNGDYRTPNSSLRFNSPGNSNVINQALVDTKRIFNVKHYIQYAEELRYQNGPFTLTGEYITTEVRRNDGLQDLRFNGAYLIASYFISGGEFKYNAQSGTPLAPSIKDGGAWEIASRYSEVDLNSKDVSGGKLKSYDFGVNYYLNYNVKFMANYIINQLDSRNLVQEHDPHYLLFRAQFSF